MDDRAHRAPDLGQLADDLGNAMESYAGAQLSAKLATGEETSALDSLNDAQRAFDAAVQTLRAAGPWGSNWGQDRTHRTEVD